MRQSLLAVLVVGVIALVAVLVRSQMKGDAGNQGAATDDRGAPTAQEPQPAIVDSPVGRPDTGAAVPATTSPGSDERKPIVPVPNVVPESPQTGTGADILRRAAAAYANVRSMRADFVQKRDNPLLGSTTTSRGTLYQRRPDRFLMRFSEPAGDIIVSDGRYFWLYYPSADRRQVLRAPASENAAGGVDLQAQFLGNPLERFTHTYHGTENLSGRTTHVITLVPRENLGYRSLKIWVDARDALVRRFILTENNGLVQEFQLSNLQINPALGDDLFRFTPPPDARIVERP